MTMTKTETRIYVASLSDYNAGRLHGVWIDADQDVDDVWEAINKMLAASREPIAEEWAIHDYEGFGPYRLSEYESIAKVVLLAQAIAEEGEAVAAFVDNDSSPLDDATDVEDLLDSFRDSYRGCFDSMKDYAYDFVENCGWGGMETIPEELENYIDWDQIAHELEMDHWTWKDSNYDVHVFRSW